MDFTGLSEQITSLLGAEELSAGRYARFGFPRLIHLMDMRVRTYRVPGLGRFMTMHTASKMGMELITMSFMPSEAVSVPYLLIDAMQMKAKRTVFVEYYDCTANRPPQPELEAAHEKYRDLADYAEKSRWYVSERTPYSLIKCGTPEEDGRFAAMMLDSAAAYKRAFEAADVNKSNLIRLAAFRERMILDGNPSSGVLNGALGKKRAVEFFREVVMPMGGAIE